MCGIFGILTAEKSNVTPKTIRRGVDKLLLLSESRGKESSGIAQIGQGAIRVLKRPIPASQLIVRSDYKALLEEVSPEELARDGACVIGHARLETNGSRALHCNNQPVLSKGCVGIHNGIVVNVDAIYRGTAGLMRQYEVDTEAILRLLDHHRSTMSLGDSARATFATLEGTASIAVVFDDLAALLLATNNGSLYCVDTSIKGGGSGFVFASERAMLVKFLRSQSAFRGDSSAVRHLSPNSALLVQLGTLKTQTFDLASHEPIQGNAEMLPRVNPLSIVDVGGADRALGAQAPRVLSSSAARLLEFPVDLIKYQKRCKKCLLPTTFPWIEFDQGGVCNYCLLYRPQTHYGKQRLLGDFEELREGNGKCVVALSGGRDSCYALHYLKKEIGVQPIAYTYDWGMVTDLARRNMSRMCAKLGVEHIIVSADIAWKRSNIQKNVRAWLNRPSLGAVPLFMAGDKQFFYYANKVAKENQADKIVFGMNPLERTDFKTGFCGLKREDNLSNYYALHLANQFKLLSYYGKEFLLNPAYLNSTLIDTAFAYISYYLISHPYVWLYRYIPWHEDEVVQTLISQYDWETAPDTTTTWRIGDGTASFYNYIYLLLAGFTESDTFRSNQIREGLVTRERAMELVLEESRPRFEAIRWYLDIIGLPFEEVIRTINAAPRLWSKDSIPSRLSSAAEANF